MTRKSTKKYSREQIYQFLAFCHFRLFIKKQWKKGGSDYDNSDEKKNSLNHT